MRSGKLRKTSPVISPLEGADPVVATSDDEDEAPESVGFAESKATALAELQSARDQIQSAQVAKKAARKRKLEKFKAQKEEKQKKELEKRQNELPLDILESLVPKKTSEQVKPNQIKKFADNDQDEDSEGLTLDNDDDDALARDRSSFKVVSKKDQSTLASHVPQDIINFRANMLNNPRIKRESAEDLINRRKKMKQIGGWNNKKTIRNK